MNHWRITKYNPQYRNRKGIYTKHDWTDISDVGNTFSGQVLTLDTYLKTENAYIATMNHFWQAANFPALKISSLETYSSEDLVDPTLAPTYEKYAHSSKTQVISSEDMEGIGRLMLRGLLWGKLEAPNVFHIHFGYDLYLYIGSVCDCPQAIAKATQLGLYVETLLSPYLS